MIVSSSSKKQYDVRTYVRSRVVVVVVVIFSASSDQPINTGYYNNNNTTTTMTKTNLLYYLSSFRSIDRLHGPVIKKVCDVRSFSRKNR